MKFLLKYFAICALVLNSLCAQIPEREWYCGEPGKEGYYETRADAIEAGCSELYIKRYTGGMGPSI